MIPSSTPLVSQLTHTETPTPPHCIFFMLRRYIAPLSIASGARGIVGVAPVLHFAAAEPKVPKDEQIKKNTAIALYLIKKFKGPVPAPYTRRHTQTFEQVEKEVEALVGGAEKMRRKVNDDQPMDKVTLIERCLRHGVWSYLKDEGKFNFAQMEKWLVYTPADESRLISLRRDAELKEKYAAFKKKRQESGTTGISTPAFEWKAEYAASNDREVVVEKRMRYDALAINTTDRDEAAVDAVLEQYRRPKQQQRLDALVVMLESFKPVIAREAIMQRLTIKHLEGQLGVWRYLDWNPEVRDRAELETDNYCQQWWMEFEEKRLAQVRLRSKNEVKDVMEKSQAAIAAASSSTTKSVAKGGSEQAARDKLMQEILRLQSRIGKKDDDEAAAPKKEEKGHGHH